MSFLLDFIIVLIVGLTMYTVIKKGFVRTVLDFASVICAIICSKLFAPVLSAVYYGALDKGVTSKVKELIAELLEKNELPEMLHADKLANFLGRYDSELVQEAAGRFIENTVDVISKLLVALVSYGLAFLTIFIAVVIVFKIASAFFGKVFELPILKTINRGLAIVLAVFMSFIYVFIFIGFMQIMLPFLSSVYPQYFGNEVIESTFIFSHLYNLKWLDIFVN